MSVSNWRFVAGAVCPRCGLMDTLRVDAGHRYRQCVDCGFEDERPREAAPAPLPTRVTRAAARRVETPAAAITLVDAAPKKTP